MSVWKNVADWSDMPDVYVTDVEQLDGIVWRVQACSVPLAIAPEVRLVRADRIAALEAALADAERFMAYFAGETGGSFVGPGTPQSCLAAIRAALGAGQ